MALKLLSCGVVTLLSCPSSERLHTEEERQAPPPSPFFFLLLLLLLLSTPLRSPAARSPASIPSYGRPTHHRGYLVPMSTIATPPPPSSTAAQEKAASRNKRKYRAEPPSAELGPFGLEYPLTADCVGFEFMSPEKAAIAAAAAVAAAAEGVNLDLIPSGSCDCKDIHPTAEELLECQRYVNWNDPNETLLEEILLKSLDATFDNAVSLIIAMGYSEPTARAAVLRAATQYNWKESLAGFGEAAVEVLKTEGDMLSEGASEEDMRKIEQAVLGGMIALVNQAQPFYTTGDVMFCLLMSDMNVVNACAMDYNPASLPPVDTQVIAQPAVGSYEANPSSDLSVSITNPQTGVTFRGKLTPVPPASYNTAKADSSSATPANLNVPSSKPSISGKVQSEIPNLKLKENSVPTPDHSEEQPFVAAATQPVKDDKPIPSKRGSSKRDPLHRQKLMSFDKSSRVLGSKGSLRSTKHTTSGSGVLDRKCRSLSDSTNSSLKGSSKLGKGFSASLKGSEVPAELSFTGAALPSTPSFNTKLASNSNLLPAASTDLSLSLPLPSSNDSSAPCLNHDCNAGGMDSNSKINLSYDEDQKVWIPQDKKDEMVLILVQRQKELQAHMRDWTDWAQQKVMQVTRRLAKEKEELHSLRKEKEEADRLQEERHNMEESTRKKLLEMESAISRANVQLEKSQSTARRREAENAQLRIQMEAAKRHALESATNILELSKKDENSHKRSQHWESERALLQEDLAAQKSKLTQVRQQLQHAKEQKDQIQARWRQEEAGKNEAIARVSLEKKERDQIETSLRSEENFLHLKAENDTQRYKSQIRSLEQQISQLKVSLDSLKVGAPKWGTDNKTTALHLSEGRKNGNAQILSNIAAVPQEFDFDDIHRDRECVMCLSEEMSVVFLPCAHQVVCVKCNDLHDKQGMKECPSCRTPIQRRVCARLAESINHNAFDASQLFDASGIQLMRKTGIEKMAAEAMAAESLVVVHNVAKRHNVGTLARSATAFGVAEVVVVGRRDDERGCDICGVEITDGALPVTAHPFRRSTAFLFGNEGTGLSQKECEICDFFVYIPQYGGGTASLNVTVAASIVLHHFGVWAGFPERGREGNKFLVAEKPKSQSRGLYCTDSIEEVIEERKMRRENACDIFEENGSSQHQESNVVTVT
uniref:RING-type domain-containing protein n=1 Tax=Leersia perrieri TaxID=77586 RepID=A0A0D9WCL2_9ORYZ